MYWQFILFCVGNVDLIHLHRLHTGDQPYPCTACGEGFRTKAELNQHNRATHGGLNPNSANTTIVVSGSQQQMVRFQERNLSNNSPTPIIRQSIYPIWKSFAREFVLIK